MFNTLFFLTQLMLFGISLLLIFAFTVKIYRAVASKAIEKQNQTHQPLIDKFISGECTKEDVLKTAITSTDKKTISRLLLERLPYITGMLESDITFILEKLETVEKINGLLKSKSAWKRSHAAYQLGIIRSIKSFESLLNALKDPMNNVRFISAIALGKLNDARAILPLLELIPNLPYHQSEVIAESLFSLGIASNEEGIKKVKAGTSDKNSKIRYWSLILIGKMKMYDMLSKIEERLKDSDPSVREAACMVLGEIGDPGTYDSLTLCLTDPSWKVRKTAADSLWRLSNPAAIPKLKIAIMDRQWEVNETAINAITMLDPLGNELTNILLTSPFEFARWRAAEALSEKGYLDKWISELADYKPEQQQHIRQLLRIAAQNRAVQPLKRFLEKQHEE